MSLYGKRIVVIGGSSGIGLATAYASLAQGAHVIISSRSVEKLAASKKMLGDAVETFALDMTQECEVEAFFKELAETFDHLVISSGSPVAGPFLLLDTATAHAVFANKFWGQYYVAKYGAPKVNPGGSIVFFSGVVAYRPMRGSAPLAAVNAAIDALGKTLALELAPIRVNIVSPGIIDTPARASMPAKDRDAFYSSLAEKLPTQKVGQAGEVAQGILALLDNPFITGTTLHVDGGHRLI